MYSGLCFCSDRQTLEGHGIFMRKRYWAVPGFIMAVVVLINFIAWNSTEFCDFYVAQIFPIWVNMYGRLTSLFPFSVGEIMLVLGVLLLAAGFILLLFMVALFLHDLGCKKNRLLHKDPGTRFSSPFSSKVYRFAGKYFRTLACICTGAALIMTLNCFPLYHCSTFEEKYLDTRERDYTLDELAALRDYVVLKVNTLSRSLERDDNGNVIYTGNMEQAAIESMQKLGRDYGQLAGYYVTPKELACSDFISQQSMRGYYFPFSMEANYNGVMTALNKPSTMCHELAHTKGFIYEDEANLIGFLACVGSDDPYFQYSGYLSVLNYIDNDFYNATGKNRSIYNAHIKIASEVKCDNRFLTEDTKKSIEEKAVVKTETVKKAASQFVNTNLLINGIPEGALSYANVVGLLMEYYDGDFDELPGTAVPGEEYLVADGIQ